MHFLKTLKANVDEITEKGKFFINVSLAWENHDIKIVVP